MIMIVNWCFEPSQPLGIISGLKVSLLVSWCFEPSQPLGVTLGLNTNPNLSVSYSAHKSFNINHNISTAHLVKHTHSKKIAYISTNKG